MKTVLRTSVLAAVVMTVLGASQAQAGLFGRGPVYRGTWQSDTSGHHGLLRARVLSNNGSTYNVRFSGTFLGVVPFVYSTPMTVTGRTPDGGVMLYGKSKLPIFGDFRSTAYMNGSTFNANYSAASDRGRFIMQRR
jgi:hypothetical protein